MSHLPPNNFDFGSPCLSYNLMRMGECWPETAGYEHVAEYFADGVGFLETEAPGVGRGLLLMFKGKHGCCALQDGKTVYWGKWNADDLLIGLNESIIPKYGPKKFKIRIHGLKGEIVDQHLAPEYAKPVALPVGDTGRTLVRAARCYFKPPTEVVFDVVSSADDLKACPEFDHVAEYIRPGVRYALVNMRTGKRGLVLRFWGDHACFVEPGGKVNWGQWYAMENWLRILTGVYIVASDGSRFYSDTLLDRDTDLFAADTTDPSPKFTKAIPTESEAPALWASMRQQ